jgi:hypothetical protein
MIHIEHTHDFDLGLALLLMSINPKDEHTNLFSYVHMLILVILKQKSPIR